MIFPDFIEQFGIDYFELSMEAIESITQLISCEFCIRPFILKYPGDTLERLLLWAKHDHPQVRRLASEGCRPRLPWAMALPFLKKDPGPILPILEALKNDPAETVRRSVANNFNDISKDNPDLVKEIFKHWIGETEYTDWIIKHGARMLLKSGDPDAMELFGYSKNHPFKLSEFTIINPQISIGDKLNFSFCIRNTANLESKLRLEYVIYYLLANGSYGRKVFKISERIIPALKLLPVNRKHSFRMISTRKFYPGTQKLSIVINGTESPTESFQLFI